MIEEYNQLHTEINKRRNHANRLSKPRKYTVEQRRRGHFQVVAVFLNYFQLHDSAEHFNQDCVEYFARTHPTRDPDRTEYLYLWQFTDPHPDLLEKTLIDAWRDLATEMKVYADRWNMQCSDGTSIGQVIQNRLLGDSYKERDESQKTEDLPNGPWVVRYIGTHVLGAASTYQDVPHQNRAARAEQQLGWLRAWYQNNIAHTNPAAAAAAPGAAGPSGAAGPA
jgi:hypothetical protein